MNKKLEEILEACLNDIKAGRVTVEECLQQYPQQARELEPLLRMSVSLRKISTPQPSEKRVLASRQRVLREFNTAAPLAGPWWKRAFNVPALALSGLAVFMLMTVLGTGVYLASRTGTVANAYPNPLHVQVSPTAQPKIAFKSISLPKDMSGPYEIASGPDGNLWFIQTDTALVGSIDAMDRKTKSWDSISNMGSATGIDVDASGKVWFTIASPQSIVSLDPSTRAVSSWPVPAEAGALGRITAGTEGQVWFVAGGGSRIYSLETKTDTFTAYDVDFADTILWADDTLWFSGNDGYLGQITPEGNVVMLEVPGAPADMVWDGGSLWYAGGSLIGQLDTASGKTFTYPLYGWTANRIASDGLGNIWFGSQGGAELGVLQSDNGSISMRSLNAMVQKIYALEVGSDRVWMSDSEGNQIYAFSIAESGEVNSPEPFTLQVDRFTVSVSFPSLAWVDVP